AVRDRLPYYFQAEDGIRDLIVTGVQTCALPIWRPFHLRHRRRLERGRDEQSRRPVQGSLQPDGRLRVGHEGAVDQGRGRLPRQEIGRASCRERVELSVGGGAWKEQQVQREGERR